MAKAKTKKLNRTEVDSRYLLKMAFYLILGSLWVRFAFGTTEIPVPVGFIIGLIVASKERFQIDRKLEYAILLMAMFISFWLPLGLIIEL